jgi:hypothetical protein
VLNPALPCLLAAQRARHVPAYQQRRCAGVIVIIYSYEVGLAKPA